MEIFLFIPMDGSSKKKVMGYVSFSNILDFPLSKLINRLSMGALREVIVELQQSGAF